MTANESVGPRRRLLLVPALLFERAARWKARVGAWAFVGLLFSLSFTAFNFVLVAMMTLAEFGLFSYGQSLVLFAGVLVGTLILELMCGSDVRLT